MPNETYERIKKFSDTLPLSTFWIHQNLHENTLSYIVPQGIFRDIFLSQLMQSWVDQNLLQALIWLSCQDHFPHLGRLLPARPSKVHHHQPPTSFKHKHNVQPKQPFSSSAGPSQPSTPSKRSKGDQQGQIYSHSSALKPSTR